MMNTTAARITGPLNSEQLGRSGRPMAFIHPNPTDLSVWLYQMAHFSTWFRAIGIDLPGYGRSPRALPGLTMTDIAMACWEAVDAVSGEPAVLAGCSVGAHVALHMAHERPEQTAAVILSGCSYRPVKTYCLERIETYGERGLDYRGDYFLEIVGPDFRRTPLAEYFRDLFVERNDTADLETIIEMFRALYVPDPDWLFELRAPVLILSGTEDRAHEPAKVLQAKIPGCEFAAIESAGHACQIEQPWVWDALAIDFLRRKGIFPTA
jgi:pimeloyl-ACP methyl ester carboxylesterase